MALAAFMLLLSCGMVSALQLAPVVSLLSKSEQRIDGPRRSLPAVNVIVDADTELGASGYMAGEQLHAARLAMRVSSLEEEATIALKQFKDVVAVLQSKQAPAVSFLSTSQPSVDVPSASLPTVNVIIDADTELGPSGSMVDEELRAAQLANKVSNLGAETAVALKQVKDIVAILKSKHTPAVSFLGKSQHGVDAPAASLPTVNVIVDADTELTSSGSMVDAQLRVAQLASKVSNVRAETAASLKQVKDVVAMLQSKHTPVVSFLSKSQHAVDAPPASSPTVNVMVDADTELTSSGSMVADELRVAQLANKVSNLRAETAFSLKQIKDIVTVLQSKRATAGSFLGKSQQGVDVTRSSLPTVNALFDADTDLRVSDDFVADRLYAARLAMKASSLRVTTADALKHIRAVVAMLHSKKAMATMVQSRKSPAAAFLSKAQKGAEAMTVSFPTVNVIADTESDSDSSIHDVAGQLYATRLSKKVSDFAAEAAAALRQLRGIVRTMQSKSGNVASFLSKPVGAATLPTVNILVDPDAVLDISSSMSEDRLQAARLAAKVASLGSETVDALKQLQAVAAALQATKL
eukprot:TRINITY_DN27990_c1_g1_i1.p1 TRINITY_DN27990_c1_g1~~TRINITY_DN27990_c1_g1_i1.p1  ORF type:complete len:580 (-),score=153.32 TRINITY_DN27990_c1_g1_i1:116-1855(-)